MHLSDRASTDRPPGTSDRRFVTSCAWCDRIRVHGIWLERSIAFARLRSLAQPGPLLTHGICERCLERLLGSDAHAGDPGFEGPRAA